MLDVAPIKRMAMTVGLLATLVQAGCARSSVNLCAAKAARLVLSDWDRLDTALGHVVPAIASDNRGPNSVRVPGADGAFEGPGPCPLAAAGSSTPTLYGINVHLPDNQVIGLTQTCGFDIVRLDVSWALIEPEQGVRQWGAVDDRVAAVRAAGLSVLMTLSQTPPWASQSADTNAVPESTTYFQAFVTEAVTRYQDDVEYWGIWNEPNGGDQEYFSGTPEQFRDVILLPAADAVHAVDPGAKVVAPGVTIHTDWSDWMTRIFNDRAVAAVDVVSVHLYVIGDADDLFWNVDYRDDYLDDILPLGNVIADVGLQGKPVWLEETGWPVTGPHAVTETWQAVHIVDVLVGSADRELIDAVLIYTIIDDPDLPPGEPQYGLLRADYSPRPAYNATCGYIDSIVPELPFDLYLPLVLKVEIASPHSE